MVTTVDRNRKPKDDSGEWVYVRCFRHWRTGKLVYPKNSKFFRFRRRRPRR